MFDRGPLWNYNFEKENLPWLNLKTSNIKNPGVMNT